MLASNPIARRRIVAAAFPPPASMNLLPLPFFHGFDQRHTHLAKSRARRASARARKVANQAACRLFSDLKEKPRFLPLPRGQNGGFPRECGIRAGSPVQSFQ
jgi:hypothetical protein